MPAISTHLSPSSYRNDNTSRSRSLRLLLAPMNESRTNDSYLPLRTTASILPNSASSAISGRLSNGSKSLYLRYSFIALLLITVLTQDASEQRPS